MGACRRYTEDELGPDKFRLGVETGNDGLHPSSDGLHPSSDGLYGFLLWVDC